MRDLFVTLAVFGLLPLILSRPWLGVLAWSWLGYMNPHKLTWGFATTMPFALMIALATMVALLVSREPKRIPWTRETILLLLMIGWMFMTTCFALVQAPAWEQWDKVWRIMLMTYVTMILITDEHRIKMLVFVIAQGRVKDSGGKLQLLVLSLLCQGGGQCSLPLFAQMIYTGWRQL